MSRYPYRHKKLLNRMIVIGIHRCLNDNKQDSGGNSTMTTYITTAASDFLALKKFY